MNGSGEAPETSSAPSTSTTAELADDPDGQLRRQVAGLWIRRGALTLVVIFVACGLLGVFGYRSGTSAAAHGDYDVRLTHPSVTRGGVAANWQLQITRRDGRPIDQPVTIETSAGYLANFDQNAQFPEPDGTAQTADLTTWEYAPPDETTFVVRLDIRTQPGRQWKHSAVTTVRIGTGDVVELRYSTWIVP